MKKTISLSLSLLFFISLSACKAQNDETKKAIKKAKEAAAHVEEQSGKTLDQANKMIDKASDEAGSVLDSSGDELEKLMATPEVAYQEE